MRHYIFIGAFALLACTACNESSTKTTANDSSVVRQHTPDTTSTITKDTTSQLYWEKLPAKTIAQLILKDSIRATTSPVIFSMLDSLTSTSKQTRQFYLPVFSKIMNTADGELAEAVGGYALTFVQNYPKEFVEASGTFSKNQLDAWASNIGIEIFLASDQNENVKEAFEQIVIVFNDNCKDCNTAQKNKLKQFTNLVWRTVNENHQAAKR